MCELFCGVEPRFPVAGNVISFDGLYFTNTEETLSRERTWNQVGGISQEKVLNTRHSEHF